MLIWFVNNPEETPHYVQRLEGYWATLCYVNVAINGVIPFLVLLPRVVKQHPKALANVCVLLLVGRWLDLYLMILPEAHGLLDAVVAASLALGAAGLYFLIFSWSVAQAALLPRNDPYLADSLAAHPQPHALTAAGGVRQ
jgi:hypothetical protein